MAAFSQKSHKFWTFGHLPILTRDFSKPIWPIAVPEQITKPRNYVSSYTYKKKFSIKIFCTQFQTKCASVSNEAMLNRLRGLYHLSWSHLKKNREFFSHNFLEVEAVFGDAFARYPTGFFRKIIELSFEIGHW